MSSRPSFSAWRDLKRDTFDYATKRCSAQYDASMGVDLSTGGQTHSRNSILTKLVNKRKYVTS